MTGSETLTQGAVSHWLDQVPRESVQVSGKEIELAWHDKGPAVLALHGAIGGYDQGLLLARCTPGETGAFQVLAPSRPGYLGTPLSSGRSPEDQADLYAQLLDTLAIGSVVVLAISVGGPSALQFASKYPERCRALILVSACSAENRIPAEHTARVEQMVRMVQQPPIRWLMRIMGRYFPDNAIRRSIDDETVFRQALSDEEISALFRAFQARTMTRLHERMRGTLNDMDVCARLPATCQLRLPVRMLAIHGAVDRVVPFAQSEHLAVCQPHVELMSIANGEHVCLFTHLHQIRARVSAFMERLPA